MSFSLTVFLKPTTWIESKADSTPVLCVRPGGEFSDHVTFQFPQSMPVEEQVAVADRLLTEVQRWRDGLAAAAADERTTADELAAARVRIAELEAERGGRDD